MRFFLVLALLSFLQVTEARVYASAHSNGYVSRYFIVQGYVNFGDGLCQ